jgi:Beta-lactamase class C and other penicillin binding proteins
MTSTAAGKVVRPAPLPTATPEQLGIEPRAIETLVAAWERGGVRPFALAIARHGALACSLTWAPYRCDDRVLTYSLAKPFTAAAVGLAIDEGLFALEDRVADLCGVVAAGPRSARITVANLLSMSTGHTQDTYDRLDVDDLPGSFLAIEPEQDPGTSFCYHNSATLMLALLVERTSGQALHDYLRPRLFDPLGIQPAGWEQTGGVDQGFSGLRVSCDDVARLGLTLLNGGMFQDRRVLPRKWVTEAMTVHTPTDERTDVDWSLGYGYQLWRSQHGWRGDGAFGQLCLVLPEQDLVLVAFAQSDQMQPELDAVWNHLLPGLHDGPLAETGGVDRLAARLALPAVSFTAAPADGEWTLTAVGPAASSVAPDGVVTVGARVLRVPGPLGEVVVPLGDGRWERADCPLPGRPDLALAGTAGWSSPEQLHARVVPLHCPHVLQVDADLTTGQAVLAWQTTPLGRLDLTRHRWLPGD